MNGTSPDMDASAVKLWNRCLVFDKFDKETLDAAIAQFKFVAIY